MSIEISGVASGVALPSSRQPLPASPPPQPEKEAPKQDIEAVVRAMDSVSQVFNRRLQFSINEKINQVVVKVIDKDSNEVIKEIPPRELQIVHERIREALGLLFDERI